MKAAILVACAAVSLSACAYNAPVGVSPNLNVYTSYSDKLPGKYLLHVESDAFSRTVKPTGINCSAHSFPLDFREAFEQSVVKTVAQLVEDVQVVERPATAEAVRASGAAGMIVVKAESLNARLMFIPGFWTVTPESSVEISASLTVDAPTGRALGTTASGNATAQSDASAAGCGGGADAVAQATEKALKELLGQLGERMSNSPRLRQASQASQAI